MSIAGGERVFAEQQGAHAQEGRKEAEEINGSSTRKQSSSR